MPTALAPHAWTGAPARARSAGPGVPCRALLPRLGRAVPRPPCCAPQPAAGPSAPYAVARARILSGTVPLFEGPAQRARHRRALVRGPGPACPVSPRRTKRIYAHESLRHASVAGVAGHGAARRRRRPARRGARASSCSPPSQHDGMSVVLVTPAPRTEG